MDNILAYLNTAKKYIVTGISELGGAVGDRLLGALESGDDKLYNSLMNPTTGMEFTEIEKLDAVGQSIDREFNAIITQSPTLTPTDQVRIDELIDLRGGVERNHIMCALDHGGIDPGQNVGLINDLGSSHVANSLVDLNSSSVEIHQNTAAAILNGDVRIQTIEDKITNVATTHLEGVPEVLYIDHNENGSADFEITYGTSGYNPIGSTDIYVFGENIYSDPHFDQEIQSTLIHETNHALNPPEKPYARLTAQERLQYDYESEFRAFWVDGTFDSVPEVARAEVINQFLRDNYPKIGSEYVSNADFMSMVDNTTQPVGNLYNS